MTKSETFWSKRAWVLEEKKESARGEQGLQLHKYIEQ